MTGVQKIEDLHECVSTSNSLWSMNWKKNEAMDVEAAIVLDLIEASDHKMKGCDQVKIKAHSYS